MIIGAIGQLLTGRSWLTWIPSVIGSIGGSNGASLHSCNTWVVSDRQSQQ